MRKPFLSLLLFSAALVAYAANAAPDAAANAVSMAGKWKIHSEVAGNEYDGECTLTQSDNVIGGSCKTLEGQDAKATGKVDGANVTWSYDAEYNGTPITITYTATVSSSAGNSGADKSSADKITGTITVDPFNAEGDFTAVAEK